MAEQVIEHIYDEIVPDISHLSTEDDQPVDNLFSAKQQRLSVTPLYDTEALTRPFLADVNVGIFFALKEPPLVPDMFLSLGVEPARDWWERKHRSYFVWEFGKPPDVVLEIVSNLEGNELSQKKQKYAQMGIHYYVVFDPQLLIQDKPLQVYENYVGEFLPRPDHNLPRIGLSLTLWDGIFEDRFDSWLRWYDTDGNLLFTGAEQAAQARHKIELLAEKLRQLGVDPNNL